jgi:5-methylcytosine-specific restriction endonuclease McrA
LWHIDHIIPISSFSFSSPEDPEFKAAWALTNLRPLWAAQNISKGAKREVLL